MNLIRKAIQKTGFDLHRHRPKASYFDYIKELNINTIFDIGANTGQFAKEIRANLPEAKIYSFEPLKEAFHNLNKNFARDRKFEAFNIALGDKEQEFEINKSSYLPSSSILEMTDIHKTLFPHTKDHTKESIKICRFDDIVKDLKIEKEILIKVDVQGFEDKVINGGTQTFQKAKIIIIETSFKNLYLGQPTFETLYQKLKFLGFNYSGSLQQKINSKTGEIISEDSIFLKQEFSE